MKISNFKFQISNLRPGNKVCRILFCVLNLIFFTVSTSAQSTDQTFPTPVSTNEIGGKIAARDIGDARLTTYFYVFSGTQGDVFINIKTVNLDGDIDVFAVENLRPLTKITVFSDASTSETGRVIYLRKPEKLILRVQGRTPNDAAATFNLKFAGSFAPSLIAESGAPELPEVKTENQSDIIVNSVGTIVGIRPKPTPAPKEETVAENEPPKNKLRRNAKKTEDKETENPESETNREKVAENKTPEEPEKTSESESKPVVVVTEEETVAVNKKTLKTPVRRKPRAVAPKSAAKSAANAAKKPVEPNPLENVQLVILFKDGTKIERAMSEVLRVGVDKGVLTLITKDGKIARFPILDVAKMTIE